MRTPRQYQLDFVKKCGRSLLENHSIIAQSPTGSGKTFMMSMMISGGLKKGKTFLVLTESKKIFNQLVNEFNAYQINANTNKYFPVFENKCYVAMAQTITKRRQIFEQLQLMPSLLLLIDEAHIGTSTNAIKLFDCPKIGFTATPAYRWAKFLPDIYKSLVPGPQVEDLIRSGALSPYRHIGRKKIDSNDLKIKAGEFTEKSQETAFGKSEVYEGLYEDLKTITYNKAIIFVASIKQAEEVFNNLKQYDYESAIFHSKRDDSEYQIHQYHNNPSINLMVTVAALTKGYDFPDIDLVVLFRSTTSLPLYLQMIGRGGRSMPNKKSFTCLDYGLNFDRFGAWDADRDWEKLWLEQKPKADQAAPMKQCPSCESFVYASATQCNFCEHVFPIKEKSFEQGELIDFKHDYTNLIGKSVADLTPAQLALYAKTKNRTQESIRIAKALRQIHKIRNMYCVKFNDNSCPEQSRKNYLQEFGKEMGYKFNWYMVQTTEIDKGIKLMAKKQNKEEIEQGLKPERHLISFRNFILK